MARAEVTPPGFRYLIPKTRLCAETMPHGHGPPRPTQAPPEPTTGPSRMCLASEVSGAERPLHPPLGATGDEPPAVFGRRVGERSAPASARDVAAGAGFRAPAGGAGRPLHELPCCVLFLTTTRSQPRLGLVEGSRGPTQIHIRGLCNWVGEPAGHLGAESPSRRTAGPTSAKRTKPPCPHWPRARAFSDAPRECGVPTPPCSALRLLSSPAHSRACPFAVARATQIYRRKRNQPGIN